VVVEGEARAGGMVVDFGDLRRRVREVLEEFDHRNWNDVLELPTVENICELLARRLGERLSFPFVIRVWEGQGKWAETGSR
jgi:6-pyruvoyltetrahydropterin/6-carboxytetrahydropterin synthase